MICWLPKCATEASTTIMGTAACVEHVEETVSLSWGLLHDLEAALGAAKRSR